MDTHFSKILSSATQDECVRYIQEMQMRGIDLNGKEEDSGWTYLHKS